MVSTKLGGLNLFGYQGDVGDLTAKINLLPAAAIGAAFNPLLGVGGAIGNLLANRYFKDRIRQFKGHIERRLPGMATDAAKKAIAAALPPPARLDTGDNTAVVALHAILLNQQSASYELLEVETAKLYTTVLAKVPSKPPLKALACSGSGRIHTYDAQCMRNNFGVPGEVFCIEGIKRFCLGNQMCP